MELTTEDLVKLSPSNQAGLLYPMAKDFELKCDVLPSVFICQAINESARFTSAPGNNFLGIKFIVGKDEGKYQMQLARTWEWDKKLQKFVRKYLPFRKYESIYHCGLDWVKLMLWSNYYRVRIEENFIGQTTALRLCGYATSPSYDINLRKTIMALKLYRYDWIHPYGEHITDNFSWWESNSNEIVDGRKYFNIIEAPFDIQDNIVRVAKNLQIIRDHFGFKMASNSWYRTPRYNMSSAVGSGTYSNHPHGLSDDIAIPWSHRNRKQEIIDYAKAHTEFTGFGIGKNYIHFGLAEKGTWYY